MSTQIVVPGGHVWTVPPAPDGGCLTCDECDLAQAHSGKCDCGHEASESVQPEELSQ